MTPTKTAELYNGEIIIDFFETKHQYKKRGEKKCITSVTAATGMINKPLLIPWAVKLTKVYLIEKLENSEAVTVADVEEAAKQHRIKKDTAAEKGTQVHNWAEQYINFKLGKEKKKPEMPKDESVLNGVLAFLDWEKEHKVKFLASEKLVYSKKHDYVGLMDAEAIIDGKRCVVDFKTSSGIYNEMRYQVAAYQAADEEESGKKYDGNRWIVRFSKETAEFDARELAEQKKDLKAFLGCLEIKKREKELSKF
jgi:hypothetical protein